MLTVEQKYVTQSKCIHRTVSKQKQKPMNDTLYGSNFELFCNKTPRGLNTDGCFKPVKNEAGNEIKWKC